MTHNHSRCLGEKLVHYIPRTPESKGLWGLIFTINPSSWVLPTGPLLRGAWSLYVYGGAVCGMKMTVNRPHGSDPCHLSDFTVLPKSPLWVKTILNYLEFSQCIMLFLTSALLVLTFNTQLNWLSLHLRLSLTTVRFITYSIQVPCPSASEGQDYTPFTAADATACAAPGPVRALLKFHSPPTDSSLRLNVGLRT